MKTTRPVVAALLLAVFSTGVAASADAASWSGTCFGYGYDISTVGSTKSQMASDAIPIPALMAGVSYVAAKPGGGSQTTWRWSAMVSGHSIVSPAALSTRTGIRGWVRNDPTPNSCYTSVHAT